MLSWIGSFLGFFPKPRDLDLDLAFDYSAKNGAPKHHEVHTEKLLRTNRFNPAIIGKFENDDQEYTFLLKRMSKVKNQRSHRGPSGDDLEAWLISQ